MAIRGEETAESPTADGPAGMESPDARPADVPADEVLEASGARIGEITIRVEDVFNTELPGERMALYRLANRLHRDTRPGVVRSQLLFRTGDRYDTRLLRESERLLRARKYLYDCRIQPVRYDGEVVDLDVWVKDVWTLKAGFSASREGGVNNVRFEMQDTNLLGTGKSVELERESTVDRSGVVARYTDGNLAGSRVTLGAVYSDNDDGELASLRIGRPFYALDTRWAAAMLALSDQRVDSLYRLGKVSERFRHEQEHYELSGGLSRGLVDDRARRWIFGLTYRSDRFGPTRERPTPSILPEDRTLVYPWVGVEVVEDAFATTHNQDQLERTEDILLGRRYRLRLGLATESFGSDRDQAVFDGLFHTGLRPEPGHTLLFDAQTAGRWEPHGFENLLVAGSLRYYWRNFGEHLFFAGLEAAVAADLDRENQLLLGGDSGLRGYPLRYQDGDARALLTLEQRFFTGWYPFRLFYIGAAVFADVGRTWASDVSGPNLGALRDVGFGLRFSSSRSGFGSVFHLDVAFPLDGDPSIESVQWLVTTKQSL